MTGQVKANELPTKIYEHVSQLLNNDFDWNTALMQALNDLLPDYRGPGKLMVYEALRRAESFEVPIIKAILESVDG